MLNKAPTDMYPTDSAVSINNVTKTFIQWQRDNTKKGLIRNLIKPEKRKIVALDNVSFEVKKGEFVAYAGPNGAGKSTTMKLLAGMLLPNSGDISVLSLSPQKQRRLLMQRIGVLFGNRTELWWDHPVIQSFEWKKVVWGIPDEIYKRNLKDVVELLDIGDLLKTFARELSLGQRMRADLAMMLLHSPELILLDEPTLGLDVVAKRQMIDFLKRINQENGVTIIVTSHDMDDLEEMAQRILMISSGRIAFDGSFNDLRSVTGNLTRLVVTMDRGLVPQIQNARLISSKNGMFEYDVDLAQIPVKDLLDQLSTLEGVRDVEIKKAPIEQVIARLYRDWSLPKERG
ncbi:MAG: ABC transporter ATP-binding protein [Caldicoprobacterales bacterium]|jgi:ABC-2 type transport system ATP-binding protein|nr:ATP-binding cassette domain-containing protein [Clostridiales bacterium]